MNYVLDLVQLISIYAVAAIGLNLMVGYGGLLSLAHSAYFAVGGYGYAVASIVLGWTFLPATLLGVSVATLLSLALSLPSWRFSGDLFILISLAVQALVYHSIYNWGGVETQLGSWENLTNGPNGVAGIPRPDIMGIKFDTPAGFAFLTVASALGCAVWTAHLFSTPWGRLVRAMRDDELAVRALGKKPKLLKVQLCALSCGTVAFAGALYAAKITYINPDAASLEASILFLCMVIIGGPGNVRGPISGAFVIVLLPELLDQFHLERAAVDTLQLMLYGTLLMVLMHVRPQGLLGTYRLE